LVNKENGNSITHGIYPLAAGALQRTVIGSQSEGFTALRHGAYQGIKHALQDHGSILVAFCCAGTVKRESQAFSRTDFQLGSTGGHFLAWCAFIFLCG
jgi:hypothetical protein